MTVTHTVTAVVCGFCSQEMTKSQLEANIKKDVVSPHSNQLWRCLDPQVQDHTLRPGSLLVRVAEVCLACSTGGLDRDVIKDLSAMLLGLTRSCSNC